MRKKKKVGKFGHVKKKLYLCGLICVNLCKFILKVMPIKTKIIFALIAAALFTSCVSRKQLAYFQPITAESAAEINQHVLPQPEPVVKVSDALIITVTALDPEAALPYNLPNAPYTVPNSEIVPTASYYQYYTVDAVGEITFPVLGKLKVAGLTQSQVIEMIQNRLKEQIVDPVVTMRFLNASVTVLGEVEMPGTYPINNGRMTILEALGAAGDLTPYGRRTNVLITRENNGQLEFARLDLTSDEIFTSPYFYLQQNDVIVVEPNQARSTSNQTISLWLSMVGTVASASTVIVSILRLERP